MKQKRHSMEEIIRILREVDTGLGQDDLEAGRSSRKNHFYPARKDKGVVISVIHPTLEEHLLSLLAAGAFPTSQERLPVGAAAIGAISGAVPLGRNKSGLDLLVDVALERLVKPGTLPGDIIRASQLRLDGDGELMGRILGKARRLL